MRARFWLAVVGLLAVVLSGHAQVPRAPVYRHTETIPPQVLPPDKIPTVASPLDRIFKALDTPGDYDWREKAPAELATLLREKFELPVVVEEPRIEAAGALGRKVTVRCKGTPLRATIFAALHDADLGLACQNDVLVVTTEEEAKMHVAVQSYWLGDLVTASPDGDHSDSQEEVLEFLRGSIRPETWDWLGGVGSARFQGTALVVSQSLANLREVQSTLAGLREAVRRDQARSYGTVGWGDYQEAATTREQLKRLVTVQIDAKPVAAAVQQIARSGDIPVTLNERKLEEAAADLQTPKVTLTLSRVSLRTALIAVLRPTETAIVSTPAGVQITTQEHAKSKLHSAIYLVGDLMNAERMSDLDDAESLMETITQTIAPTTWDGVGGPGTIQYLHSCHGLVIPQTEDVHAQIEDLLANLRQLRAAAAKLPPDERRKQAAAEIRLRAHVVTHPGRPATETREYAQEVLALVRQLTPPETWTEHGVSIHALPGRLIIRHRHAVQDQIRRLLTEIEHAAPPNTSGAGGGAAF